MSASDFVFDFGLVWGIAAKMVIVIAIAMALNAVQRRAIPRLMMAWLPRSVVESDDALAARATSMAYVLIKVIAVIIWIIAGVMILGIVELDISPLLATLGIASLGLGFAVQNVIRDYLQGFFIVMEDWYRIGDWVAIAGTEGEVEKIEPRCTVLREINGTMHMIPNGQILQASNQTRDWAGINLIITVAYKEDISHVYQVIDDVCQGLGDDPEFGPNLTTTPTAMRVSDLGDHGVDICIRGHTRPGEQWGLTGELRKRIKNRFDEVGIEIPWPHTKVYFANAPQ